MPQSGQPTGYLTTRQAAKLLGISLRTAQLWVENGQLEAWKTQGGHRRIKSDSVQRLLDGAPPERRSATTDHTSPGRIRVLIVEDDNILLKLYQTVIAGWKMPIDVITASNGIDGLIRIGKDAPQLMITDLAMPGIDGIQLIRLLAASSFREGLEIIVVSGLDNTRIKALGDLPGDIQVFSKPVPFLQLKNIVSQIIEGRAACLTSHRPVALRE